MLNALLGIDEAPEYQSSPFGSSGWFHLSSSPVGPSKSSSNHISIQVEVKSLCEMVDLTMDFLDFRIQC